MERAKVKGKAEFVRRKTLDEMAHHFGLYRRKEEPDNELFARLQALPDFQKEVDRILLERYESLSNFKVENNGRKTSFMDELKKL